MRYKCFTTRMAVSYQLKQQKRNRVLSVKIKFFFCLNKYLLLRYRVDPVMFLDRIKLTIEV